MTHVQWSFVVDIDEAADEKIALLNAWKKYREAFNRMAEQPGYPGVIDWSAPPA